MPLQHIMRQGHKTDDASLVIIVIHATNSAHSDSKPHALLARPAIILPAGAELAWSGVLFLTWPLGGPSLAAGMPIVPLPGKAPWSGTAAKVWVNAIGTHVDTPFMVVSFQSVCAAFFWATAALLGSIGIARALYRMLLGTHEDRGVVYLMCCPEAAGAVVPGPVDKIASSSQLVVGNTEASTSELAMPQRSRRVRWVVRNMLGSRAIKVLPCGTYKMPGQVATMDLIVSRGYATKREDELKTGAWYI